MSRTHEILHFVGQRLLWGVQGGALVFCLMQMSGSRPASATAPAAVTVQAPDVHVHLAPTAPAPPPAPATTPAPEAERTRLLCASVGLTDGLHVDRFRGITYVDRAVVDRALEQQALRMRSARLVPELRDGHTVGVRLLGVRPNDTLLGRLGFENGDVLRSINGLDVASPERALEAYARLRAASELLVLVERQGTPRLLEFRVC